MMNNLANLFACQLIQSKERIFQDSTRFCMILQDSARFCKILQESARFCKIQQKQHDEWKCFPLSDRSTKSKLRFVEWIIGWIPWFYKTVFRDGSVLDVTAVTVSDAAVIHYHHDNCDQVVTDRKSAAHSAILGD